MDTNTELINDIIDSKLPMNWVTPKQFSLITGIPVTKLHNRKKKWKKGEIWINDGEDGKSGNVYYSLEGFNKWLNEQAIKNYRQAFGSLERQLKSTSRSKEKDTKLRSRYLRQQQERTPLRKLEVS